MGLLVISFSFFSPSCLLGSVILVRIICTFTGVVQYFFFFLEVRQRTENRWAECVHKVTGEKNEMYEVTNEAHEFNYFCEPIYRMCDIILHYHFTSDGHTLASFYLFFCFLLFSYFYLSLCHFDRISEASTFWFEKRIALRCDWKFVYFFFLLLSDILRNLLASFITYKKI